VHVHSRSNLLSFMSISIIRLSTPSSGKLGLIVLLKGRKEVRGTGTPCQLVVTHFD